MKTGRKADKSAGSRFAKIEGKKLHYLTAGQGPALILLHGYTQTSRMWHPLIDKLKDKFTVIAPDLPGIGDSDIPKDLPSVDWLLLNRAISGNISICGHRFKGCSAPR